MTHLTITHTHADRPPQRGQTKLSQPAASDATDRALPYGGEPIKPVTNSAWPATDPVNIGTAPTPT